MTTIRAFIPTPTERGPQLISFDISLDSADWQGRFDSLEVWRSVLGAGGPYESLTGAGWLPARIPPDDIRSPPSPPEVGRSVPVVGLDLQLVVDEKTLLEITFSGINPMTFAAVATQLQSAAPQLVRAFVLDGKFVVESATPGPGSFIRVQGGDAAPLLGLPTAAGQNVARGTAARIPLLHSATSYTFADPAGRPEYFYKIRFYDTETEATGEFSLPFQVSSTSSLSPEHLVTGTVDLVDSAGNPLENREVLVQTQPLTDAAGRTAVGGTSRVLTDLAGHAQFSLVRGARVTVAIAGTSLVRDVLVPTDTSIQEFDLLSRDYGTDDVFKVQIPPLDFAVRRTL